MREKRQGRLNSESRYLLVTIIGSLLLTILAGLILRWQYAGEVFLNANLDLRRAHSHIAYYGILFPMSWYFLKSSSVWLPGQRLLQIYLGLSFLSFVFFLIGGYGFPAKVSSTGVLLIWLIYAWKNSESLMKKSWSALIAPSISATAALIFAVALTTAKDPMLSSQLARTFLALLYFGVFIPSALKFLGLPAPMSLPLLIAAAGSAVFLGQLSDSMAFNFCLLVYVTLIGRSLLKTTQRSIGMFHWMIFLFGSVLLAIRVVPLASPIAIAGIHYLSLGPLLITFADRWRPTANLTALYSCAVILMSTSIALMSYLPDSILLLQRAASISGSATVIIILSFLSSRIMAMVNRRTS